MNALKEVSREDSDSVSIGSYSAVCILTARIITACGIRYGKEESQCSSVIWLVWARAARPRAHYC